MRVILVGSARRRADLRAQLDGTFDIAGEFSSLALANASGLDVDGILIAPDHGEDRDRASADEVADEPLTAREVEVLELLAEGLPNKAIAARLRISDQTVKFHVASISAKLGASNRTDAVRRAVRRGLVTL